MKNTNTNTNKFQEYLNDNVMFTEYKDLLDVHHHMLQDFNELFMRWSNITKRYSNEIELIKFSHIPLTNTNDADLVRAFLDWAIRDYITDANEAKLKFDIKHTFETQCKDKFHAVLCGKEIYKAMVDAKRKNMEMIRNGGE